MSAHLNNTTMTRRTMLKRLAYGTAGLALLNNGGAQLLAALNQSAAPAAPPVNAPAKSVIQIWMWGGPSHLDTFDPKPAAGYDYCGLLKDPIATNVDGIRIGQLLPNLAKHADKYSIIRSMTHGVNAHETASYIMQTGHKPGRLVYPSLGAVVSLFKGYDHGYAGVAPPYIVLTTPQGRFSEAGFLGQKYKPFATGGDPAKTPFAVEGIVSEGITDQHQRDRRELMHSLDTLGKALPGNPRLIKLDQCEDQAYETMFGEARTLFDLSHEKVSVRELYGMNTFGQSCLAARRLVESGVPHITINYRGWDTHKKHFEIMNRKLPEMDQGMAALLQDLHNRGLLDSTIVLWGGEFGRGPKIQWDPPWNGGRSHYGACFSCVVAGGGFKGGHVVGASDEKGMQVAERPVSPQDLIGSIYELLGIDPDGPMPNPKNMDVTLLPKSTTAVKGGGRLKEIMKV
jgi:uncharacterized protein (DUF1501 family)